MKRDWDHDKKIHSMTYYKVNYQIVSRLLLKQGLKFSGMVPEIRRGESLPLFVVVVKVMNRTKKTGS